MRGVRNIRGACPADVQGSGAAYPAEWALVGRVVNRPTKAAHQCCPAHETPDRCKFMQREQRQKQWSRPVSRVLCALRRDSHSSRPSVAAWLKQPTRERRGPRHRSPIWSCSGWGLPCRSVARLAVGSYPTVSPLPDPLAGPSAVCSLLHFPSARAAQALPGTLPCGARTFLGIPKNDATVRPTPMTSIVARRYAARGEGELASCSATSRKE